MAKTPSHAQNNSNNSHFGVDRKDKVFAQHALEGSYIYEMFYERQNSIAYE